MSIVTLNDRGVRSVTTFGSLNTGSMVFIKKLTASSSGTLDFVNGTSDVVFDSTYKEYLFTFKDIHPSTKSFFKFQADTGTNTNYNQTITSTHFRAAHNEADSAANLNYATDQDQAQGTDFQSLAYNVGSGNDESISGILNIFNPSSSTFVKHFLARANVYYQNGDYSMDSFTAGYFNTTTALTRVRFKMSSGNIDAGDICLYGIN